MTSREKRMRGYFSTPHTSDSIAQALMNMYAEDGSICVWREVCEREPSPREREKSVVGLDCEDGGVISEEEEEEEEEDADEDENEE